MRALSESSPIFADRAQQELNSGDFESAERTARNACRLSDSRAENHLILGKALQLLELWDEAALEFMRAIELGAKCGNLLKLTEGLINKRKANDEDGARIDLFEALRDTGRQMESIGYSQRLGEEFWKRQGERIADKAKQRAKSIEKADEAERAKRKDPSVVANLVRRLEAKLLAVPGTEVLMSKTEFTVAEWKLYLRAEGFLELRHQQVDDHPVVDVSWNEVTRFCKWLSSETGKVWRLPKVAEWEAAIGGTEYPWGNHFPPRKEDGNFNYRADGKHEPNGPGVDGFSGTAPVASFKPNPLGFYDLGGNVWEMALDGFDTNKPNGRRIYLGGGFNSVAAGEGYARRADRDFYPNTSMRFVGFRVCRELTK
jgi:formylglycine-generating enzyme required for sulfatase activity